MTYYIYYKGRITRTAETNEAVREYLEEKLNNCGQQLSDFMVRRASPEGSDKLTLEANRIWEVSVGGR